MSNTLRVEKKDIYVIEVNDEGDTIEFDLVDIELPLKAKRCGEEIYKLEKKLKMDIQVIKKKPDVKGKYMSKNEEDLLKLYKEHFRKEREIIDGFLGKNACKKIFGDRNYIGMYDDLAEQLEPHFKKMQINVDKVKDRLLEKYSPKSKNVI